MTIRLLTKRAFNYGVLNIIFVLMMILSTATTVKASEDVLNEIRSLLQTQYVEPVSDEVLNSPTIEEMMRRLGDPHTMVLTPAQYQEFVEAINMRIYGIGTRIEIIPEGVKVLSVIAGSPAEEIGLKPGDIITFVDGQSLSGLASEEAISLLRGLEGSTVQIRVKQGNETRDLRVTRRAVSEPTVTGEVLDGHIGYLDLNSFGEATPLEFETAVTQLKDRNVDCWIVDLRDNGGGYLSAALKLAGYFIGSDVAVQIKDRTGTLYPYKVQDSGWKMSQPVILLINEYSASASEILAASLKDHNKAALVGTTTYGKGTVQRMFPLSNGGVLKMTVDHFYSPLGYEIDKVGVSPDVVIQETDSLMAAELLLSSLPEALVMARTDTYWETWGELTGFIDDSSPQLFLNYSYYYPSYRQVAELFNIPLNKQFRVDFSGEIDWKSVNNSSIELINSTTGERMLSTFQSLGPCSVQVIPNDKLTPDTSYWLVIHPTILGVSGQPMQKGGLAIVHTKVDHQDDGLAMKD